MNERPILFSTPMVRAILDGTKTQTRRIFKEGRTPFYAGQYLWVKETWRLERVGKVSQVIYRTADGFVGSKWKSSLFMPKKFTRLVLQVECVKTEKLQDITDEDAWAEGMRLPIFSSSSSPRDQFHKLWDIINAKKGYSWDSNPLVWVVEFKIEWTIGRGYKKGINPDGQDKD